MKKITDEQRDLLDNFYTDLKCSKFDENGFLNDNGIPFRSIVETFVKKYYPTLFKENLNENLVNEWADNEANSLMPYTIYLEFCLLKERKKIKD
jgi:hypothetical protein